MAQRVKDLALSLLWHGFNPQSGNLHMPQVQPKSKAKQKKKKKKKKKTTKMLGENTVGGKAVHFFKKTSVFRAVNMSKKKVRYLKMYEKAVYFFR